MRNFATESGKSKVQFYTPAEVSRVMAKVIGIKQAKKAVSEGAEVVYFACTIWGGMLKPISDALEVPVIDPVISMLKTSEMVLKSKKLSEKDYFRKRS